MTRRTQGVFAVLIAAGLAMSCDNNDSGFVGNQNFSSLTWTDQGSEFNGAFGWNDADVSSLALMSGTACDEYDSSVDIINGLSIDPCSLERNADGTPFNGTITGVVCNGDADTETAHTITCEAGLATEEIQEVWEPLTYITLFASTAPTNGALGGRTGADAYCQSHQPAGIGQLNIRAFISINANDELRDMPDLYGISPDQVIQTPNGTQLSSTWAGLFDGLDTSPVAGGITDSLYWTHSFGDGGLATPAGACPGNICSCNESTDGTGAYYGAVGDGSSTGSWLALYPDACSVQLPILCVAYDIP